MHTVMTLVARARETEAVAGIDHLEPPARRLARARAGPHCRAHDVLRRAHDAHVAWNDGPDWAINPHFVGQVKKIASVDRPVVLICRSGQRSVDAGIALEQAGFSEIINVLEGFEGPLDERHQRSKLSGWRKEGLPWEQT